MDTQTGLICATFVVVSLFVVYFTSLFAMKEKTYDEALEEQRQRQSASLLKMSTTKSEKSKKEKKKEKVKKDGKKAKEKETVPNVPTGSTKKDSGADGSSGTTTPTPSTNGESGHHHHHKGDHVEFKAPEIIVEEEDDKVTSLRQRRKSPSVERPTKPILVNKKDATANAVIDDDDDINETSSLVGGRGLAPLEVGRSHRSNSFDIIRPKDELELMKQLKKQSASPQEQIEKSGGGGGGSSQVDSAGTNSSKRDSDDASNKDHHSVANRKHKKQKLTNVSNAKDFIKQPAESSPKNLIHLINSVPLNDEEIQVLIDALLNKQSDATEWTKKSDPLDSLKKQLREKEACLETEKSNSEALTARIKELRHDLDQEKSKLASIKTFQEREIQAVIVKYSGQQSVLQERHRSEIAALQAKWQSIIDDKVLLIQKLQEENARLQKALQESEAKRVHLEGLAHLSYEVETLKAEKQQYEMVKSSLEQTVNELNMQLQGLKSRLDSVSGAKEDEKRQYEGAVNDVRTQLEAAEHARSSLINELEEIKKNLANLVSENKSLKDQIQKEVDSKEKALVDLNVKLNQLANEKTKLEEDMAAKQKQLEDVQTAQNAAQSSDSDEKDHLIQQLTSELDKTKADLSSTALQLQESKKETELQSSKFDQAVATARENEDSMKQRLSESEAKLAEVVQNNEKALDEISSRLKAIEEESASLRSQRESLVACLSKFNVGDSNNIVESVEGLLKELDSSRLFSENRAIELEKLRKEIEEIRNEKESIAKQLESDSSKKAEEESRLQTLEAEKLELESRIQQFKDTLSEVEQRLAGLEDKLKTEEAEKQTVQTKYDEVSKEVSDLKHQIESNSSELTQLSQLKEDYETIKKELDDEKQTNKDLQSQCVRLKSLVKCGVDALNAEQKKVEELELRLQEQGKQQQQQQQQTGTNNGTNGSLDHKSNNDSSSLEEAVSPEH